MSLAGCVAGPNHDMDWMTGVSVRPGLHDEYVTTTGAILGGRNGWDRAIDASRPYGGAWQGPIFVLTHHPEDAAPAAGVTFLTCGLAEGIRLYDNPGGAPVRLRAGEGDDRSALNVRYRPVTCGRPADDRCQRGQAVRGHHGRRGRSRDPAHRRHGRLDGLVGGGILPAAGQRSRP